ncbi:acetyltransferase [Kyrpidia spormannii]|uniref:Acetyltransferase n=1 Tax=Kyrpidia spormannii TaxID=2055160 RepID=A0A2K8N5H6_9BACL|nr:acyltransferase family protein [Kyrpidia spormannii]ATY84578.1 acetyltransferase [Kyrpidia spormannii]
MPEPMRSGGRYMPGLDGLRALAVLAVLAYHLNPGWAPGGMLGVGVFFVLSGYLITDLLAEEWRQTGRIDLRDFWMRRFRRLIPALWLLLITVILVLLVSDPGRLGSLWGDLVAAFFYVSNWWYIFHHISYFQQFGPPSPFGHLWSLAVEEQFYLLWPLLLALGLRRLSRRWMLTGILTGAILSAGAMAWIYQPGVDPSRVYYGTDTRAFALLFGAALALVWPSRHLAAALSRGRRRLLSAAGIAGLLVVLILILTSDEYGPFLYPGGMLLLSLATLAMVAAAAHPGVAFGRILGWAPLRWIGVRSYGIYLWHYPVIVLTTPLNTAGQWDGIRAGLQVAASIGLAALSWRFIEKPILRRGKSGGQVGGAAPALGSLGRLWTTLRKGGRVRVVGPARLTGAAALSAALLLIVAGSWLHAHAGANVLGWGPWRGGGTAVSVTAPVPGMGGTPPEPTSVAPTSQPGGSAGTRPGTPHQGSGGTCPPPSTPGPSTSTDGSTEGADGAPSSGGGEPGTGTSPSGPSDNPRSSGNQGGNPGQDGKVGTGITVVGDSVLLDAAPYLQNLLPGIVVDGKVGRQFIQAGDVAAELERTGKLGDTVIIELGTNGPFTDRQLDDLLAQLAPRRVLAINVRVPRPWQDVVNRTLAEAAARHPDLTVIDWYRASSGKTEWFYSDGVHLTPQGSRAYAELVAAAIRPNRALSPLPSRSALDVQDFTLSVRHPASSAKRPATTDSTIKASLSVPPAPEDESPLQRGDEPGGRPSPTTIPSPH